MILINFSPHKNFDIALCPSLMYFAGFDDFTRIISHPRIGPLCWRGNLNEYVIFKLSNPHKIF